MATPDWTDPRFIELLGDVLRNVGVDPARHNAYRSGFYARDFGRWQHKAQMPPKHGAVDFERGRDGIWRMPT